MAGNYSGLSSSDEGGRNSPNVERNYDLWFMSYDLQGNPLDGPLQHDRTHYFKAYGSYAFPFGLTVGTVFYGRSGLPLTTSVSIMLRSSPDDTVIASGALSSAPSPTPSAIGASPSTVVSVVMRMGRSRM